MVHRRDQLMCLAVASAVAGGCTFPDVTIAALTNHGGAGGGCATSCDCDGDQHPAMGGSCGGQDCDDLDPLVHEEQTEYFATARLGGSFDYDCDGVEEPNPEQLYGGSFDADGVPVCTNECLTAPPAPGYSKALYACGTTQFYYQCNPAVSAPPCETVIIPAPAADPLECH